MEPPFRRREVKGLHGTPEAVTTRAYLWSKAVHHLTKANRGDDKMSTLAFLTVDGKNYFIFVSWGTMGQSDKTLNIVCSRLYSMQ